MSKRIQNTLRQYQTDLLPFELVYGDDFSANSFPIEVGDDYAILLRFHQRAWPNGFRAIRFSEINEINPTVDAKFIGRAMRALNHALPPEFPFGPKTMNDFLGEVCEHFPIVVLGSVKNDESVDVAGTIQSLTNSTVVLRTISFDGLWNDGIHEVPVQQIDHVFFGSNYETTLELMSDLPD